MINMNMQLASVEDDEHFIFLLNLLGKMNKLKEPLQY